MRTATTTNKTRSISANDNTWKAARRLANANTGGNISLLFEQFITFATFTPSKFGLHPPADTEQDNSGAPSVNESLDPVIQQMIDHPAEGILG